MFSPSQADVRRFFCAVYDKQRGWSPLSKPHRADASIGRKRVHVLGALNYATGTLAE